MKNQGENDTILISKTIFDDTHRTMLEKVPELMLPVINEVFRTAYRMDEPFVQLKNEHVDGRRKRVTDSCLCVRNRRYHFESQSNGDGMTGIRMMEYDFYIAMEAMQKNGGIYEMAFPHSCVIYLRGESDLPDLLKVKLIFPDGQEALYGVPVVKVQSYTLQEIFEKGLVFFIPFYLMRYEEKLKLGSPEDACQKLLEEYDRINLELPGKIPLCPEDIKTGKGLYVYSLLMDMVQDIVTYIIPEGEEKERMVKHMGGEVREYSADRWWARLLEERECTRKMEKRAEEQEKRAKELEKQMKEKMKEQIKEQEKQMREQEKKMECLNHLNERLAEDGRLEDILRAAREPAFRQALMREYQCG